MAAVLPNTLCSLARLGYSPQTRLIILHADDLGMCLAHNEAYLAHAANGFGLCGSIMATCPWVAQIARAARSDARLDLGVHITLNAEWTDYRWPPLTGRDPAAGLIDGEGYQWSNVPDLHDHMNPAAAIAEMRAQVQYLLDLGVDLTHIDTHMGTVLHPYLAEAYVSLGTEFRLPVMVPRNLPAPQNPAEAILRTSIESVLSLMDEANLPIVDHIASCSAPTANRLAGYLDLIDALPPGITHLLYHAAVPGPEIEAIDRGNWALRVADYQTILDPAFQTAIADRPNVQIIGYRALRDQLRAS
ncbi:MAG: polysaccharide deacetylase family protein [Anaerolineae bacterium]